MGLIELRKEGFKETETMAASLHDYKRINNNVLYFIEQHVEADPQGRVVKSVLYEEYVKRTKSWSLMPLGEPQFRIEFSRLLRDRSIEVWDGKKDVPIDSVGGTRRANAYCGFSLIDEKPEAEGASPAPFPLPAGGPS